VKRQLNVDVDDAYMSESSSTDPPVIAPTRGTASEAELVEVELELPFGERRPFRRIRRARVIK
jgi:hypothetical protein